MTLIARFWNKVNKGGPLPSGQPELGLCWTWLGIPNRDGYGTMSVGGRGSSAILAHRLSWELHFGPIPDGLCVLHKCDNPPCVRPDHLFLGTNADNSRDMALKGRAGPTQHPESYRGDNNGRSKLTANAVAEIRRIYSEGGVTQKALAVRFGVQQAGVSKAVRGATWEDYRASAR